MDFTNLFLVLAGIVAVAAVVVAISIFWQKAKERVSTPPAEPAATPATPAAAPPAAPATASAEPMALTQELTLEKLGDKYIRVAEQSTGKEVCVFDKTTQTIHYYVDEIQRGSGTQYKSPYGTFYVDGGQLMLNPSAKEVRVS